MITRKAHWNLISKNMDFANNRGIFEFFNKMFFTRKILRWHSQAQKPKNCSVVWVNHLQKIFMPIRGFIKINFQNRVVRRIPFCTNLARRNIMALQSSRTHGNFGHLAQIGRFGSCQNLMRGNITIHAIEAHIFWQIRLQFRHQWNQFLVFIRLKFPIFPKFCELRIGRYDHWINFKFIRPKILILKNSLHRRFVEFRRRTDQTRHHMCHHFKARIFEQFGCKN